MKYFFVVILFAIVLYAAWQAARTHHYIQVGTNIAKNTVRYTQEGSGSMRILFLGDSTAVGVGASSPETSIAGLAGKKYPQAEIMNKGVNGATASDTQLAILGVKRERFDLVMLHVGGNDVVHFTSAKKFRADIRELLAGAKALGDNVLLTSTGNVGTVPLFPAPTRWIFAYRTRLLRQIMIEEVANAGEQVRFTDLYREGKDDPFLQGRDMYYAADYFHPSDAGYADWFSFIEKELDQFLFSQK